MNLRPLRPTRRGAARVRWPGRLACAVAAGGWIPTLAPRPAPGSVLLLGSGRFLLGHDFRQPLRYRHRHADELRDALAEFLAAALRKDADNSRETLARDVGHAGQTGDDGRRAEDRDL